MQSELKALAERVQALTGPCRETDAEIAVALEIGGNTIPMHGGWCAGGPADQPFLSPAFTASLDAAMTLLPETWVIASLEWWPITKRASVALREVSDNGWGVGYDESSGDARAQSATPALALTAAAIRAIGAP